MKTKFLLFSVFVFIFLMAFNIKNRPHSLFQHSLTKNYVEIPAGKVIVDGIPDSIEAFAISKFEVSNRDYLQFLYELKEDGNLKDYQLAQVKIDKWQQTSLNQQLIDSYHTYPGFADFPVININRQGAELYCDWLTNAFEKENQTDYEVIFRLPTRKEWIRAARGENIHATYAWGSPSLRDAKGYYQCNYKRLGAEQIYFDEGTQSYKIVEPKEILPHLITDKVDAYSPNDFGLYNVCGNVAEMIYADEKAVGGSWFDPGFDVRVESFTNISEASPYVGFRPVMIIKEK